jgi:predicted RND superfamily exporter protein
MIGFFAFVGIITCAIFSLIAIAVAGVVLLDRYQTREYRIKQLESRIAKLETQPIPQEGQPS